MLLKPKILGIKALVHILLGITAAALFVFDYLHIRGTTMAVCHLMLRTGAEMPMIGLGTWNSSPEVVKHAVTTAINAGYRHIDCAADYENEDGVGDGIKSALEAGKLKREELFVTSKLWLTLFGPGLPRIGLGESSKKLKLDYLDLYLLHFPFAMKNEDSIVDKSALDSLSDESIDYVDTWKELISLQKAGMTKAIGVSNFNQVQIERLARETGYIPDVHQFECHPYLDQTALVKFCQSKGIVVTGYSPLGSPGNRLSSEPNLLNEAVLLQVANNHKKSVAQVLLRYQIQRDVVVIPKSVNASRIVSNIQVFDFELSGEEMKMIKGLNQDFRTCDVDGWASKSHKYYPFQNDYKE